jgi:hypothetical protein
MESNQMQALAKIAAVSLLLGLSAPVALAKSKQASFRCVNAKGGQVEGVTAKADCAAPNKWVRLHKKGPQTASAVNPSEKKSSK